MNQRHLSGQVTLDYVLDNILNTMKADERDYVHLKQIVMDGYSDLCLFHINNLRVRELDVEDGNVVTLPPDYLYYSKVAVIITGKVYTLTRDDKIPLPRNYECGDESQSQSMAVVGLTGLPREMFLQRTRGYNYAYYADTGSNVGYYRIDEERRLIVLKGVFPNNKIILEYATIPINMEGDTLVSRYVVPTLRAYVMYKVVQYDLRVNSKEKEQRKQDYMAELGKLRMIENQMTTDEWMDVINATRTQSPKR